MPTERDEISPLVGQVVVVDTATTFLYVGALKEWQEHFVILTDVDAIGVNRQRHVNLVVDDEGHTQRSERFLEQSGGFEPQAFFPAWRPQLNHRHAVLRRDMGGVDHALGAAAQVGVKD